MSSNNKIDGDGKNNSSNDSNNKCSPFMPVKYFIAKLWV